MLGLDPRPAAALPRNGPAALQLDQHILHGILLIVTFLISGQTRLRKRFVGDIKRPSRRNSGRVIAIPSQVGLSLFLESCRTKLFRGKHGRLATTTVRPSG